MSNNELLPGRKINLIFLLVVAVFAFIPVLWFRPDSIIGGGDRGLPLNYKIYFEKGISAWDSSTNAGRNRIIGLSRLPEFYIFKLISLLNLPDNKIQIVYFSLLLVGVVSSFYFFSSQIMAESQMKERDFVCLFGSVLYFFNFFSLTRWEGFDRPIIYITIGIPLIIGLVLKNLKKENYFNYFFLGIFSTIFSYSVVNPPSFLAGILTIFIFYFSLLGHRILNKNFDGVKKLLNVGFKSLIVVLLSNLYWLIPTFGLGSPETIFKETAPADWLGGISFDKVMRLMGAWYWYDGWGGKPYAPYAQIFQTNKIFIILTYLLPVVILIGLLLSKNKKRSYFLIPILLVGIILSMGDQKPIGVIYRFLYENFIFFKVFRSPWFKFSLLTVLAYSFYYGVFSSYIIIKLKKILFGTVSGALFLLFLFFPIILSHPLITAPFFDDCRVKIPEYINDSLQFLDGKLKEGQRIYLPTYNQNNDNYSWGYLSALPVLYHLSVWPILGPWYNTFPNDLSNQLVESVDLRTIKDGGDGISNFLSYLGVKYLILRKDMIFLEEQPKKLMENRIKKQKDINLIKSFSEWDLYENSNSFSLFSLKSGLIGVPDVYKFLDIVGSEKTNDVYCIDCGKSLGVIDRISISPEDFLQGPGRLKRFEFDTEEQTKYLISFKNNEDLKESPLIYLDDKRIFFQINDKDKKSVVEISILPGRHRLDIDEPVFPKENLIKNGDFSENLKGWDYSTEGASYGLPIDSSLGEFGLDKVRLLSVNQTATMSQKISGLKNYQKYRLRFNFKSLSKLPLQVGIEAEKDGAYSVVVDPEFKKFISTEETAGEVIFIPTQDNILVNFYAKVNSKISNSQILSNISLKEIHGIEKIDIVPVIEEISSDLNLSKLNSSHYRLSFFSPDNCWLNFNNTFDKGWKAFENGKELNHILINSFANSYYISEPGNHSVDIIFQPQQTFIKMSYFSTGFLFFLFILSLTKLFKKK